MTRRRRNRAKLATPRRLQSQHERKLQAAAATAGVPIIQRDRNELALQAVPQIGQEPTPVKETVRRLTRIEKLARSGVLEPHEASACSWYAERYATALDGSCRTSNFEGRSGGGAGVEGHIARSVHVMRALDDYRWARAFIPSVYLEVFEAIIARSDTIAQIAAETFADKARSQAEHKTRTIVKLCANLLFDGIKALLPIEQPLPSKVARSVAEAVPAAKGAPAPRKPVTDEIHAKLDEALLAGIPVVAIQLGHITARALASEAPASLQPRAGTFRDFPIIVKERWPWGVLLKAEEDDAAQAA